MFSIIIALGVCGRSRAIKIHRYRPGPIIPMDFYNKRTMRAPLCVRCSFFTGRATMMTQTRNWPPNDSRSAILCPSCGHDRLISFGLDTAGKCLMMLSVPFSLLCNTRATLIHFYGFSLFSPSTKAKWERLIWANRKEKRNGR